VFVLMLVEETQLPERSLMLTVVAWTVALSVYAHGLSAWPGANRYADWYAAHRRDHGSMPESVPATEQRLRVPALPRQGEGPTEPSDVHRFVVGHPRFQPSTGLTARPPARP
jgi:sodium/hydrogen antiporter